MPYGSIYKVQEKGKSRKQKRQLVSLPPATLNNEPLDTYTLGPIRTIKKIYPKTRAQTRYVRSLEDNVVTVAIGDAGCGKTLLAMYTAVQLYNNPNDPTNHIMYLRVLVDNPEERQIGFLEGDKDNKLAPYAKPAINNCKEFMSPTEAEFLFHKDNRRTSIEIPEFMEGCSLRNTFLIVDEAHAFSRTTLNMLLERIGEGSRIAILGYPGQRKNKGEDPLRSLEESWLEEQYEGWGLIRLTQADNFRNPLYRKWEPGLKRWLNR